MFEFRLPDLQCSVITSHRNSVKGLGMCSAGIVLSGSYESLKQRHAPSLPSGDAIPT